MISIGNDIVALGKINKQRTIEFKFYSKILTAGEQTLYHQSKLKDQPFENYVWLLWSIKESAFKYLKRGNPALVFSTSKIIVTNINLPSSCLPEDVFCTDLGNSDNPAEFYTGEVISGSHHLFFRSKICSKWIATVVDNSAHFENVQWHIHAIDDNSYHSQSKAVRHLLINKLNIHVTGNLQITKNPIGYPVILKDQTDTLIAASLAHDDHFVACSFKMS